MLRMTIPQVFRFHDIASVSVRSDAAFVSAFFDAEYGYHRVDAAVASLPQACLDFHLGSAAPEGFTHHTHKLLARWGYQVSLKPGEIDLRAYGNRAAVSMVHHMLVHPSLRWLAAGGGTLLLHAGAVAKNNKSLIFTGKGGAGKTTTTSLVLASGQGWQIHADDYVFLREGQSRAYVTRSHLYRDLQNWVPAVRSRLTAWERARLEFFGALRKYSHEGIKWPVRLGPERLWPGIPIANTAVPAAILLLERADVSKPGLIPVKDLDEATDDLLEMNFGEARHFLSLLRKAGALDDQWLSAWKAKERSLLSNQLLNTPTYRLVLPLSQSEAASAQKTQASLMPFLNELVK
jgi:hypothetical protein